MSCVYGTYYAFFHSDINFRTPRRSQMNELRAAALTIPTLISNPQQKADTNIQLGKLSVVADTLPTLTRLNLINEATSCVCRINKWYESAATVSVALGLSTRANLMFMLIILISFTGYFSRFFIAVLRLRRKRGHDSTAAESSTFHVEC